MRPYPNDASRELFLSCECSSMDHLARFSYFATTSIEPAPNLYLTVHLKTWRGFWRRAWTAICYALGRKSRFGEWDEVIVDAKQAADLRKLLDEYIADAEKAEAQVASQREQPQTPPTAEK